MRSRDELVKIVIATAIRAIEDASSQADYGRSHDAVWDERLSAPQAGSSGKPFAPAARLSQVESATGAGAKPGDATQLRT